MPREYKKTTFLKFPVWKLQWDTQILENKNKYCSTLLVNHLDNKAQEQIMGLKNNYTATAQLNRYYSDAKKIMNACLDEVRAHPAIILFHYKAMVSYKK